MWHTALKLDAVILPALKRVFLTVFGCSTQLLFVADH